MTIPNTRSLDHFPYDKFCLASMPGEQGIIYLADDFGLCSERYKIGSPL